MDLSLLLNNEEYKKRFAEGHSTPYIFEVFGNHRSIVYFGVRHSRDSHDSQWSILKEYWTNFLKDNAGEKVVLLEGPGGFSLDSFSEEEVIARFGEVGLLAMWARAQNVSYIFADLSMKDEFLQLKGLFEEDLVWYFVFARSAGAWLRGESFGSFQEVIEKAVHATALRIPNASDSLEFYSSLHKKIFDRELSDRERDILIRAAAPIYNDSVLNDIARASGRVRNEHIVLQIEKYWREEKSIFVLFGSAHAVIQEKAVKSLE